MSEISQTLRTTTVESSMKSEHTLYLACEDSPPHAFFFWTFSSFYCKLTLSLLLSLSQYRQPLVVFSTRLHTTRTLQRTSRVVLLMASGILGCQWTWRDAWVPLHACECNWHSLAWQTHTYEHCENRSLIQSLALMRSGITTMDLHHSKLNFWRCYVSAWNHCVTIYIRTVVPCCWLWFFNLYMYKL